MVLLLHSQRQYIFDYDLQDRLSAVTMPSVARHTMHTIRSVGYYRNIYHPPESNASVTVDYRYAPSHTQSITPPSSVVSNVVMFFILPSFNGSCSPVRCP